MGDGCHEIEARNVFRKVDQSVEIEIDVVVGDRKHAVEKVSFEFAGGFNIAVGVTPCSQRSNVAFNRCIEISTGESCTL